MKLTDLYMLHRSQWSVICHSCKDSLRDNFHNFFFPRAVFSFSHLQPVLAFYAEMSCLDHKINNFALHWRLCNTYKSTESPEKFILHITKTLLEKKKKFLAKFWDISTPLQHTWHKANKQRHLPHWKICNILGMGDTPSVCNCGLQNPFPGILEKSLHQNLRAGDNSNASREQRA